MFIKKFGPGKVRVVPQAKVADRINAGRLVIRHCAFSSNRCKEGLDALRSWQFEFNAETSSFSKDPKHDWASHGADAFTYGALVLQEELPKMQAKTPETPRGNVQVGMFTVETLDQMWADAAKRNARYRRI